jgi:hypothetical protein
MKTCFLLILFISVAFAANSQKHFISDTAYRDSVHATYVRIADNINPEVFAEIEKGKKLLNPDNANETEAYEFLYAYMPLEDLADYSPEYFARNVLLTYHIKNEIPWGKDLPEDVFRHFVMPLRINNANLDSSRSFFYHQLKSRVDTMDMLQAALEVNHWCHEHVSYQASDDRTSSPITTYFNGYGRCGEESTFTVAALRAVGIPARQVYTPRWAHTDDNHAWVEFWANGKWHFYGACEPVPEPDMGWFTEPARRAMLVNTRVIGKYRGSERILIDRGRYCILNTLNVYAKTKILYAKVVDKNGNPVAGASVDFQLYNYGEYYTIAPKKTDSRGITSFETGMGSLLVWAHKFNEFDWQNVYVPETDTVYLRPGSKTTQPRQVEFTYTPPAKPEPRKVDAKGKAENDRRLKAEDKMRAEWEASFMDSTECRWLARRNQLDFKPLWTVIQNARANWQSIAEFVDEAPEERKQMALELLQTIAVKDLHDSRKEMLNDHLMHTPLFEQSGIREKDIYLKYLLNPRISYEMLTAWRGFLQEQISKTDFPTWVDRRVRIDNKLNFYRVPISPAGIYRCRVSDSRSADLMRVALYRAHGIPARLEAGTLKPEYYEKGQWKKMQGDVKTLLPVEAPAYLQLLNPDSAKLLYYKHFTLAQFQNGQYRTLEYQWFKELNDFGTLELPAGDYRLTSGNRLSDGSVLVYFDFFRLQSNDTAQVKVIIRKQKNAVQVLGKFPLSELKLLRDAEKPKACSTEPAYRIYLWYRPNNEPSKHAVQDLGAVKDKLEQKGVRLRLISEHKLKPAKLDAKYFGNLPQESSYRYDPNLKFLKAVEHSLSKQFGSEFPYLILVNPKDEIIYFHEGYSIGIGEAVLKLIDGE